MNLENIDSDLQAAKRDGFLNAGIEGLSRLVWQVRKSYEIAKKAERKSKLRAKKKRSNGRRRGR